MVFSFDYVWAAGPKLDAPVDLKLLFRSGMADCQIVYSMTEV